MTCWLLHVSQSLFALVLICSLYQSPAKAQIDSAQWIMELNLEASGGRALWDSTWSVRMKGVESIRNGGYSGSDEDYVKFLKATQFVNGDAYIHKKDTTSSNIYCFSKHQSYLHILRPHDSIHYEIRGEIIGLHRAANGNFATQHSIINQDSVFQKASYGGVYKSGEQAWWLVIFNRDGREVTWFVNTQTHLLDRIESSSGSVILLSDYETMQGRHRPTHFVTKKKGKIIHDMRITDIQYNVDLPICTLPHDGGQ